MNLSQTRPQRTYDHRLRDLVRIVGDPEIVAEFDVPAFADRSLEHALHAATTYERGLAEYPGSDLVALGFLMPVLVGQFDPDQPRHTFEQPIAGWVSDLEAAGLAMVLDVVVR